LREVTTVFRVALLFNGEIKVRLTNVILAVYIFLCKSGSSYAEETGVVYLDELRSYTAYKPHITHGIPKILRQLLFAARLVESRKVNDANICPVKVFGCLAWPLPLGNSRWFWTRC
jgi:hypothetical protein